MITLKTREEIEAIGRAGRIIAALFEELTPRIEPGVTTGDIDTFCDGFIRSHEGALPAFKGLYGFPKSVCTSTNEEVVHGIPSHARALKEGDILTVDIGVKLDGWFGDSARTYAVGEIAPRTRELLEVTKEALREGIAHATVGSRMGDVGHAIQSVAERAGFTVVRDLVGHGIGRSPHEEPSVHNWGRPGRGLKLREGMVLAIEPMVNEGRPDIITLDDGWTVITSDRKPSAHFEHTVAILTEGPRILTTLNGG